VVFLVCYGGGAVLGVVGAVLGHVARRQIRDGEGGAGMALAGVIVGWVAAGLGLLFLGLIILFVATSVNLDTTTTSTYDLLRAYLAR
jgi:hypothetical protein